MPLDFESGSAESLADRPKIAIVLFVADSEYDDIHAIREMKILCVIEIPQDDAEVIFAAVVLVAMAIEGRQIDASRPAALSLHQSVVLVAMAIEGRQIDAEIAQRACFDECVDF